MRRILVCSVMGACLVPILVLVVGCFLGVAFRPAGVPAGDALREILQTVFDWRSLRDDVLKIWAPIGGATGALVSLRFLWRVKGGTATSEGATGR
ncbi:MAG: hypothetical protein IT345_11980 [Trueperaceae bacterium]|nr:hypothetical protein [Trueperaceae bacterium]